MLCLTSTFLILTGIAVAGKIILKLWYRRNGSYTCLVGKTAVITGANTGIGYITALDFAKRGARVILACRNEDKAEEARRTIVKATNNTNVVYKHIDMTSFKSVRQFVEDFNATEERLDILVNNAGSAGLRNKVTDDGLQIMMQINHLSGFLLTHLLLDKLKKSAPSRIVNVSSITASFSRFNLDQINGYPNYSLKLASLIKYSNSKLCNILFTTELAKRIAGSGVTVNALHPGAVYTEIYRGLPSPIKNIFLSIANFYFRTPDEGAQTTIYVAVAKEIEGVNGKLFDNCREIELYAKAKNDDLAQKVWRKSEELTKLSNDEKVK